jgi:signal transduction histidine kinase
VEELLRRAVGEHIQLATALADGLWPVLADAGKLEQVLVNLAVNARDAMPGGGTLTVTTANVTSAPNPAGADPQPHRGRHVQLRVSDTGTGMTADVIERAFEPFFTTKAPEPKEKMPGVIAWHFSLGYGRAQWPGTVRRLVPR